MPNDASPGIVPTRKAAAAALGITERQLGNWTQEPWFPADAVGQDARGHKRDWNIPAILAARDAAGRKGSDLSDAAKKLKLKTDHEKLKQAELETEKRRIELAARRGELVPREALELFAATLLTSLGDWCDQLPDLVKTTVPKKYRKKLADRITAELNSRRQQASAELARAARDFDSQRQQQGRSDGQENPDP